MSIRQNLRQNPRGPGRPTAVLEERPRLRPEDILRGLLIGIIVLAVGLALGQFTFAEVNGRGTAYFVLALGLGIVLAAVTYRKLELAMMAYLVVAWAAVGGTPDVATGVSSGAGKGLSLSLIGVAFLLFFWVLRGLTGRGFAFVRTPLNGLLVLYLAFNVLCAVNGRLFWDPTLARFYGPALNGGRPPLPVIAFELTIRLLSIAAFWLFANNLQSETWLRRASWLLLVPGVMSLLSHLFRLPVPGNDYSGLTEVVLACTLFAWLLEPIPPGAPTRRGLRALGWLLLAVIFYQVFYLGLRWVSGYLSLTIGLYFVAFMYSRRFFAKMLVFGAVFYASVHVLISQVIHKVQTSGDTARFDMARGAILYALHYPLGVGPANYRNYNAFYGSSSHWNTATFSSAHDFYAEMLSEMGFPGLIITLAFVFTALVILSRFYRRMAPGWSRTFLLGICGMWAGVCGGSCIGDYVIPVYYNGAIATFGTTIYLWLGLGIGFAHARRAGLVSEEKPAETDPAPALPSAAAYYPRRMKRDAI